MDNAITEQVPLSIFITGATSPLGRVVTRHLTAAGYRVAGLTDNASGAAIVRENGGLPVFADASRMGELKGIIAMQKADVVIHLAHQAANQTPVRPADWQIDRLEADTEALCQAATEAGVKFYLHTSYAHVYGDHSGHWVDETTRPEPGDNPLLKAALHAERRALDAEIPSCILRLGYLYGAESDALESLASTLRAGLPLYATDGYANWLHLEDAAAAIRVALEAQHDGGIYNIVDFEPCSSIAFVNQFASALGLREPSLFPAFAARLSLNTTQLDLLGLSVRVKNTRALEALGWSPRFVDQQAGLDDALLTWRARAEV